MRSEERLSNLQGFYCRTSPAIDQPNLQNQERKIAQEDVSASTVTSTPTLEDLKEVKLLGRVERERVPEETSVIKKKRPDESPKPSKKKSNSKPTSDDLKSLNDKWAQRFVRFEAMILAKSFAVPVEPVQKPAEVVTSDEPFFDPRASTSQMSTGAVTQSSEVIFTGASPVQATGDVAASMTATRPVEAPSDRSEVHSQPTGTGSVDVKPDQSLTSRKTVTVTGVADSVDELHSAPGSPAGGSDQGELSDRDTPKDEGFDHELSEEANYRETIRGVRSFMGWHKILDFNSSSSS